MTIAQVKVPQDGVVQETLKYDVLVAGCASVVYTTQAVRATRRHDGVCGDDLGVLFDGLCQKLIVLPLATCKLSAPMRMAADW
jgi:hypothetical protein